jgi:RNA polymerase sigma-70 factor (ECF subfamily)
MSRSPSHPVSEHIPRLRRYAVALVRDRMAADDLVQDTLERAWSRWHLFQPGTDLRAWLFTIMHNVFANQIQAAKARPTQPLDDEVDRLPVGATQEHALQMRDLRRCLDHLPAEQRELLLLIGLEQLSYEQAAAALGIPIGTVMSRLARGRDRLRGCMAGDLPATIRTKS